MTCSTVSTNNVELTHNGKGKKYVQSDDNTVVRFVMVYNVLTVSFLKVIKTKQS